ncbi:MAG: hypothetical protein JO168_10335 [Solirubrobacterales bacterium]|nr:hypothetical protein [Solirubrobacterales bacterium]MBV9717662.1 hypothetical protein [Solirubrobacterales bacterium]
MEASTVIQTPPASPPAGRSSRPPTGWRSWLASPFVIALAACAALAALSAAVLPTVPSYDPWAWIVWGREVTDPHLSFAVGGGPSWKPLPVILTTVYGLFGGGAPTLWVITARAGGLLGIVAAYRLAAALARGRGRKASEDAARPRSAWPIVAGGIAAAGVALTQDWAYYMFRGTSEPMLIAAALWAIDRHVAGRRGSAFAFGVAAALIRPEAWPMLLLYAVWLWVRERRLRAEIVIGLLAIPFFWFVPPWIGSGDPFLAASHAKAYNGHLGSDPFVTVVRRGVALQTLGILVLGLVGVGIAWRRGRDRLTLTLAGFALLWWVIVVAMTLDGYPGLERFYLPAAAVTCVLAGAAVVWLAQLGAVRFGGAVGVLTAVVLVAALVPFVSGRISTARDQERVAARAVTRLDQLSAAVATVGGHDGVYPCRSSFAAVNHGVQTALAWKLHVTLGRVGTVMRHQGVLFVGPHDTIDGGPPPISRELTQIRPLASVGAWRVYRVTAPGAHTRCVGGLSAAGG